MTCVCSHDVNMTCVSIIILLYFFVRKSDVVQYLHMTSVAIISISLSESDVIQCHMTSVAIMFVRKSDVVQYLHMTSVAIISISLSESDVV